MDDQPKMSQPPPHIPGGEARPSPEPLQAVHFAVAASFAEFLIGLGRTRLVIGTDGQPNQAVEWFASVALSPLAARQLRDALSLSIEQWEERFGQQLPPPPPAVPAEK
jgi:hypothetical protein